MDDLTLISRMHTAERPPSPETTRSARRRLLTEATAAAGTPARGRRVAPLPRSKRAIMLVAAATACVLAGVSWTAYRWETRPLYHPEPLANQSGPASTFLLAAADAKTQHASDGRFWRVHRVVGETVVASSPYHPGVHYTLQLTRDTYSLAAKTPKDFGTLPRDKGPLTGTQWDGPDVDVRPATPADAKAWGADLRPSALDLHLTGPDEERGPFKQEGAELDFGVQDERRLPANPSELRAWILNYATKFDHQRLRNPDLYLFTAAPILLVDRVVTDRVRIATYRMLAGLRDVRMINATDAAGHPGRGVAMRQTTRDYGTIEWQLLIDPETGRLTASQGIVVTPGPKNAGLRPGTRQFFEIVKTAEWTNAPRDSLLPKDITDPNWQPPVN
ncbi:hypothetical protein [Actinomadura montaniterrae]|uniref:CU044_5270 family protein n=1 Tax=Actinomadura montaniterrae TaxID=1803903 RepID=A0A6L3VVX1_9ACTN|nr:hypothetical protein [Actinomadura montaniterrae]KAB2379109.1 hypothetical protein F9B16_21965 [Actinomadura montaniterrae]